jgi:hypothetical protein
LFSRKREKNDMVSSRQPLRMSTRKGKVALAERRASKKKAVVRAGVVVDEGPIEPIIVQDNDIDKVVELSIPATNSTPVVVAEVKSKKGKKKDAVNG